MKQIASFTIDHMKLLPGFYVSRKDRIGNETITTFDIRMTRPNYEPVMQTGEMHTIEHLAATYLRNQPEFTDKVIYFGPMGCRTGFYLLLGGDYDSKEILPLIVETYEFIRDFTGDIPGATPENCGNYSDMDLEKAKYYAGRFLDEILYKITEEHLVYPA
jgi:S-ribosylhomocysteine lyase